MPEGMRGWREISCAPVAIEGKCAVGGPVVVTNATGEFGVFESDATNLDPVSADTNGVRDVFWFRRDGERIVVWWQPPRDATAPVYLYLPGNGANLMSRDGR